MPHYRIYTRTIGQTGRWKRVAKLSYFDFNEAHLVASRYTELYPAEEFVVRLRG
jgi:hypothetical protein